MSQHFTPAELDAIETLDDKATPAPWRMADHLGRCGDIVAVDDPGASLLSLSYEGGPMIENEDDVRLLVAMRNALERLGRELRRCWALLEPVPGKVEHRAFECKGTCGATTPHKRPFKSAQPWACAGCGALQRESRIVTMEELVYYDGPQLVLFEHPDGALYVGSLIGAHRSGMRFIAARIQP
ncbi:MAG TPA: hypothetical protein VHM19_18655, partial [Polyangiales bacterium]|nr:hypothetical protein [Polyangiales bacterium]